MRCWAYLGLIFLCFDRTQSSAAGYEEQSRDVADVKDGSLSRVQEIFGFGAALLGLAVNVFPQLMDDEPDKAMPHHVILPEMPAKAAEMSLERTIAPASLTPSHRHRKHGHSGESAAADTFAKVLPPFDKHEFQKKHALGRILKKGLEEATDAATTVETKDGMKEPSTGIVVEVVKDGPLAPTLEVFEPLAAKGPEHKVDVDLTTVPADRAETVAGNVKQPCSVSPEYALKPTTIDGPLIEARSKNDVDLGVGLKPISPVALLSNAAAKKSDYYDSAGSVSHEGTAAAVATEKESSEAVGATEEKELIVETTISHIDTSKEVVPWKSTDANGPAVESQVSAATLAKPVEAAATTASATTSAQPAESDAFVPSLGSNETD